jgi:aspartate 1-decarboxylase
MQRHLMKSKIHRATVTSAAVLIRPQVRAET